MDQSQISSGKESPTVIAIDSTFRSPRGQEYFWKFIGIGILGDYALPAILV